MVKKTKIWFLAHMRAFDIKTFGVSFLIAFSVYLFYPISTFMLHGQSDEVPMNADSVILNSLVTPILFSLFTAFFVAGFWSFLIKKDRNQTILTVLLTTFLLVRFEDRFSAMLPVVRAFSPLPEQAYSVYSGLLLIVFFVVSYYAARLILKLINKSKTVSDGFATIVMVASVFLLLTTLIPFGKYLYVTRQQLSYQPAQLKTAELTTDKGTPNIYYIVLDRHTNNTVLKDDFNYDSSAFLNNLRGKGFSINENAYANYPYTALSIASTMKTGYLTDLGTDFGDSQYQNMSPLFTTIQSSPTVQALKNIGYKYQLIGNWFGTSDRSALADEVYFNGSNLTINGNRTYLGLYDSRFIENSYAYEFLKDAGVYSNASELEQDQYQVATLKQLATSNQPNAGTFTFAHILVPHNPFVFNADGSIATYDSGENNIGKPIKQKYLDQVTYIDNEIKEITDTIIAKDPQAVIVLQSDEGIYPYAILQDEPYQGDITRSSPNMDEWSDRYLRAKFGILAAYRLPGVSDEQIASYANSVNIFKLILNEYFNAQIEYDPVCHIGLSNRSKYYSFTDLTNRLEPNADATACADK